MRRVPALALVAALTALPARADLLYRDWQAIAAQDAAAAERLLQASGDALRWANAVLDIEGKPRLFCPPPKEEIAPARYRALLEAAAADAGEGAAVVDLPILLLKAMRAQFPCAGPAPAAGRPQVEDL